MFEAWKVLGDWLHEEDETIIGDLIAEIRDKNTSKSLETIF